MNLLYGFGYNYCTLFRTIALYAFPYNNCTLFRTGLINLPSYYVRRDKETSKHVQPPKEAVMDVLIFCLFM